MWKSASMTRSPPTARASSVATAGPMPRSEVRGAKSGVRISESTMGQQLVIAPL